jgi:hypothetical protein
MLLVRAQTYGYDDEQESDHVHPNDVAQVIDIGLGA